MNAEFLNDLKCKYIKDAGGSTLIELTAELLFQHDSFPQIIVPLGFRCDFASVPRLPIVFVLWGDRAHRAAVVHDYLYRTNPSLELTRKQADIIFRDAMICTGAPWKVYWPMYLAVRAAGWFAWHKNKIDATMS